MLDIMDSNRYSADFFGFLARKDGVPFDPSVVNDMYIARTYILKKREEYEQWGKGQSLMAPSSRKHFHFRIGGSSPLMLMIARQLALVSHYPNFKEYGSCRTVISIDCSADGRHDMVLEALGCEEYLGNLLSLAKYTIVDSAGKETVFNSDSYLDIEFVISSCKECPFLEEKDTITVEIGGDDPMLEQIISNHTPAMNRIDWKKASLATKAYGMATLVNDLTNQNTFKSEFYKSALSVYRNRMKADAPDLFLVSDQKALRTDILSNIFVSDCFESRVMSVISRPEKASRVEKLMSAPDTLMCLSRSEHYRWVVEKLILGFRPMTGEETIHDQSILDRNERKAFRSAMKDRMVHINICPYDNLIRTDRGNLKYDCFLILAVPYILKKTKSPLVKKSLL